MRAFPPDECDTAEAQREWLEDQARAEDHYDAEQPTKAELDAEEAEERRRR